MRSWLTMQANLQLAPKTLSAYARWLEDFLMFCTHVQIDAETATREAIALYVQDLTTRAPLRRRRANTTQPPTGFSNATLQLRLTAVRLYYDSLVEHGLRAANPIGRGQYTASRGFAGTRARGLVPRYHTLPWIPTDTQWQAILEATRQEPVRNQVMVLLAYEGALRREEVVTLTIGDIDPAFRQITIRAECTKTRTSRVVFYTKHTGILLGHYLHQRRAVRTTPGSLFLSESHRNRAHQLSARMWSHVVEHIAARAGVPQFTPHTLRHLRLTHMARADLDIHHIATYAGHKSLQTTMEYIHLSGRDLVAPISQSLADIDAWIASVITGGT
jgi:site-specific recombinase XerD